MSRLDVSFVRNECPLSFPVGKAGSKFRPMGKVGTKLVPSAKSSAPTGSLDCFRTHLFTLLISGSMHQRCSEPAPGPPFPNFRRPRGWRCRQRAGFGGGREQIGDSLCFGTPLTPHCQIYLLVVVFLKFLEWAIQAYLLGTFSAPYVRLF